VYQRNIFIEPHYVFLYVIRNRNRLSLLDNYDSELIILGNSEIEHLDAFCFFSRSLFIIKLIYKFQQRVAYIQCVDDWFVYSFGLNPAS